jgi:hypothetical protein
MQECEQALSHIQLSVACGDSEGAAKRAQKLLNTARKLRDTFLPSDCPRCDKCSEPLTAAESKSGAHCRKCAILMPVAFSVTNIKEKKEPESIPDMVPKTRISKPRKSAKRDRSENHEVIHQLRLDAAATARI